MLFVIWATIILNILALIWVYRNVHESPVWLISNGYNKKLFKYFEFLSKYNKHEEKFNKFVKKHNWSFENKEEEVFEVHTREDSFKGAILNNSKMRKNFFIMMFFWISTSCIYYIILTYPKARLDRLSKDNLYKYYYLISGTEILGILLGSLLFKVLGPSKSFVISYSIVGLGSLLLILSSSFYQDIKEGETDLDKAKLKLAYIAKFGAGSTFSVLYCTTFLFPP